jgi:hypothetical protein
LVLAAEGAERQQKLRRVGSMLHSGLRLLFSWGVIGFVGCRLGNLVESKRTRVKKMFRTKAKIVTGL